MDANYHTHTFRCGHARGSDEQYVKAAIDAGFKILGFSDHAPYPGIHIPSDRMDMDQLDDYYNSLMMLRDRYKDHIDIKIGFEIEYFPFLEDHYRFLLERADYLIVGQHNPIFLTDDLDLYAGEAEIETYGDLVVQAIESGLVSMVAHPDYFMIGRRSWPANGDAVAHRIASAAAKHRIPLEINLNGLRYGTKVIDGESAHLYPYRRFWEIVAQHDVLCVYGVDAHHPTTLMEKERLTIVNQILIDLPLTLVENYRLP
jgi:histidinol-phosphatase (PHP family)